MSRKKRYLFVGTGGGNDIFSTTLAMNALQNMGWHWDECGIAGVLSPFHDHSSLESAEFPGVTITMPDDTRSLLRKGDARKIGFVDAAVSRMVMEEGPYQCTAVYGLSLHRGSAGLIEAFRALMRKYDYIVLVDLGGDIFYGGKEDSHVLSPMFDAMVLRGFVDSNVRGCLFEAGPGTDGELEPERIRSALDAAGASVVTQPLRKVTVTAWEALYKRWIEPVRTGRTVPMTIEAWRSSEEFIELPYRARAHIGAMKKYAMFTQRISTAMNRNFYLVDPKRIINPFAVACKDPYDWFIKTQVYQTRTNCEANLEYLKNLASGAIVQFVTPSPLFSQDDRIELMATALQDILNGAADGARVFVEDFHLVPRDLARQFTVTASAPGMLYLAKKVG